MRKFAVIGNPINHSKSPEIQSQFANEFNMDITYGKILTDTKDFEKIVTSFFNDKLSLGLNITVPFKEKALEFADIISEQARLAGAANTLMKKADPNSSKGYDIFADNTDGIGLIRDIEINNEITIKDKNILLIGAGGAARGVILPILKQSPKKLIITNRTISKAESLANKFNKFGNVFFKDILNINEKFDIIINATSVGLTNDEFKIDNYIFAKDCFAYDMFYGVETNFLKLAKKNNAKISDGFGMLIEQAAESFYIWNNKKPNTSILLKKTNKQEDNK